MKAKTTNITIKKEKPASVKTAGTKKEKAIQETKKTEKKEKKEEETPKLVILDGENIAGDEEIIFDTKKRYFEAIGRKKNAIARARLFTQNKKGIEINNKPFQEYFKSSALQKIIVSPLEKLKCQDKFGFIIKVKGGGISGQAGAVRHAIARTLVSLNPYFKKRLKKSGYLTRDPRMRERKKPGLKRARKAPQWSKR